MNNGMKNKWIWVNWVDSAGPSTHWQYMDELKKDNLARATTVGYCVEDNDEVLDLASTVAHEGGGKDEQVTAIMTIPWCSVTEVFEIK